MSTAVTLTDSTASASTSTMMSASSSTSFSATEAATSQAAATALASASQSSASASGSLASLSATSSTSQASTAQQPVTLDDLTQAQQMTLLRGYDNVFSPSGLANAKARATEDIEGLNKYLGKENRYMPKGQTTREDLLYILTGDVQQYPSRLVTIPPDGELCSSSFSIRSDLRWVLLKPPGDNFQDGVRWATLLEYDDTPVNIKQLTPEELTAFRAVAKLDLKLGEETVLSLLNRLIGKICPVPDEGAPFVVTHTDVLYLVTGNYSKYPSPRLHALAHGKAKARKDFECQISALVLSGVASAAIGYNQAHILKKWEAYQQRSTVRASSSADEVFAKLQRIQAMTSSGLSTFSAQQTAQMQLSGILSRGLGSSSKFGSRASTDCGHGEKKESKSDS